MLSQVVPRTDIWPAARSSPSDVVRTHASAPLDSSVSHPIETDAGRALEMVMFAFPDMASILAVAADETTFFLVCNGGVQPLCTAHNARPPVLFGNLWTSMGRDIDYIQ